MINKGSVGGEGEERDVRQWVGEGNKKGETENTLGRLLCAIDPPPKTD